MGKIISVANQKGGVGKTTTSVNLGASLAHLGKKVLLVDIDPQGNATTGVGFQKEELEACIYDVLVDEVSIKEIIKESEVPGLHIAPATRNLAGAEIELVPSVSRETRLKKALSEVKNSYDYMIIDCPPSLGLLTLNSLTASDSVLIPVQCEFYALEGLGQLLNTIHLVQKHLNKELQLEGVLPTMYDKRTNLGIEVKQELKEHFKDKLYHTSIPRNVRLSEAPSHGKPILQHDARSRGSEVYLELAEEVMQNG